MIKKIVDDLHGVDPSATHEIDHAVLVVFGRRNADETDLTLALQVAEKLERGGIAVPGARPGVELQKVESFRAKEGAALGDIFPQVSFCVAFLGLAIGRWGPDSRAGRGLGGDEDLFCFSCSSAFSEDLGDELFAAAVSVAGGGIDEVASEVERAVQGFDRVGICLLAPATADGPSAEADFRAVESVFAKGTIFHGGVVSIAERRLYQRRPRKRPHSSRTGCCLAGPVAAVYDYRREGRQNYGQQNHFLGGSANALCGYGVLL